MGKVIAAITTWVDGSIVGPEGGAEQGLAVGASATTTNG